MALSNVVDKSTAPTRKKLGFDVWLAISVAIMGLLFIFLVYPLWGVLQNSVHSDGGFTLEHFTRFFTRSYYFGTIKGSSVSRVR